MTAGVEKDKCTLAWCRESVKLSSIYGRDFQSAARFSKELLFETDHKEKAFLPWSTGTQGLRVAHQESIHMTVFHSDVLFNKENFYVMLIKQLDVCKNNRVDQNLLL